jgi:hypothetical protein
MAGRGFDGAEPIQVVAVQGVDVLMRRKQKMKMKK